MSIYLGLGSNLGDREANIKKAIRYLRKQPDLNVVRQSKIIETKPYGKTDQPDFLNCVVEVATTLSPHELLKYCLTVEKLLGRVKKEKWGPRIIDIDVLFYKDKIINSYNLTVPHYEVHKRYFVLRSLREIASNFVHPIKRQRISDLYRLAKAKHDQEEKIKDEEIDSE